MQTIQNALLAYVSDNKYFSESVKFSGAMAVVYPVYLIVSRISFLDFIWRYIGMISAIIYIAYIVGTLICFAKNELLPLDIAYGCMTLNYILGLQYGISLNRIIYIGFYGLIFGICIKATKSLSQSAQFEMPGMDQKTFCPNCGNVCSGNGKFCSSCGAPLNR